ncbi:MAG TPA: nucleotidyltransferase domain-containing protein [Bryobacteraceae bacterium]|nr:nucleotidyltransferase domain-containing protein [Bryobacteraceae bacterium]
MEQKLTELTARLKATFGDRLVSAILYGSAAAGDWNQRASDLNILCVLSRVSSRELRESEPIFHWWREQGNPPPLLMSEAEVRDSTDCFPMEFRDMQAFRRTLTGSDIIAGITVDRSFYRAQVEHELRSKLLRLRQKAAETLSRPEGLAALLADSVSTFCVLGRHSLLLQGREVRWAKQDVVADMEKVLAIRFDAFKTVLTIRAEGKVSADFDTVLLFEKYIREIEALITFVDQIDK